MESTRRDQEMASLRSFPTKMWSIDQQMDPPLGPESNRIEDMNKNSAVPLRILLLLAFQSLGVVYGDLGTSTLYVFRNTFPHGFRSGEDYRDDILGALSLVIYTFTLIPLLKYMVVVLSADDNGEGGTFALYALLCRHCKFSSLPSRHPTDEALTTYSVSPAKANSASEKMQRIFEKSVLLQNLLLLFVLLSTCMVIGDGILTPAISVLSAVDGIKAASSRLDQGVVVIISVIILLCLFSLQRYGTSHIGFLFAPVVLLWFLTNGTIGIYNIAKYDASVFRAFSPHHGIKYLVRNKRNGWSSLGGIVLCITGTEALYADLGHFSAASIRLAFSFTVFPCMLLAYIGQAAFLMRHPEDVVDAFYKSLPDPLYWPVFVLATIAASIASQAIISATFSIVKQAAALGCFPRVKVIHTSTKVKGQVFIPEVNWIVMVLCLIITASFRDTPQIGHAYGIAVVGVMLSTTVIMFLVMVIVWHKNLWLALIFLGVFGAVECVYYSAVLFKVKQGGWVPIAIAGTLLIIMFVWHYGTIKRYEFEAQNKVSVGWVLGLGQGLGLVRVPGIGLVYTDLAHGIPPILSHFITNLPAIHSVLVFVCIKYLPVSTVPKHERFHVKRIGPRGFCMFRCAARYGYMDIHKKDDDFEHEIIGKLNQYIKFESLDDATNEESSTRDWTSISTIPSTPKQSTVPPEWTSASAASLTTHSNPLNLSRHFPPTPNSQGNGITSSPARQPASPSLSRHFPPFSDSNTDEKGDIDGTTAAASPELKTISATDSTTGPIAQLAHLRSNGRAERQQSTLSEGEHTQQSTLSQGLEEIKEEARGTWELEMLQKNRESGVVYILGSIVVRANKSSSPIKKFAINYLYALLRKLCRDSLVIYKLPHESLLQVGMVYYV